MATSATLGTRRNGAQLHAVNSVEREVRNIDHSARSKYLHDFTQAFLSYDGIIEQSEFETMMASADLLLVGDYHALPASQRYAADLLERHARRVNRPIVLAVEAVFSRHQHVLDEWWRREIDETELRQLIRFDLDWNYNWAPFYELLVTAREQAEAIYGLDCMPRGDLRRAAIHDRHAVDKIAEICAEHPDAVVMVLFGESHLAPGHLPRLLQRKVPEKRLLTILQNVDALYWQATGERDKNVASVQVKDDVICVFNSTPLEKYEYYRMCLDRWSGEAEDSPDLYPAVYNVLQGLVRELGIMQYSARNSTQPKFLVDRLPEVYNSPDENHLRLVLSRIGAGNGWMQRLEERGCAYVPAANTLYIREFRIAYVAEELTRFLHHACRGSSFGNPLQVPMQGEEVYALALENCLGYFGSRLLCPARPGICHDLQEVLPEETLSQMFDLAGLLPGVQFRGLGQRLGYCLGNRLYEAYIDGWATKSWVRSIFMRHNEAGAARKICREILSEIASRRKKPCASVRSSGRAVVS